MEHPSASLFSLSIDPVAKAHLSETAKWARFLAIVGLVMLGLILLVMIFASTFLASAFGELETDAGTAGSLFSAYGAGLAVIYIIVSLIWFFPLLYLLRFANKMKVALHGNDQQALNVSLQNLKICFRYVGIITVIVLALYALLFLLDILGATMFR